MNRNSNISKDLSAHAAGRHLVRSPIARWHNVFSALGLLTLLLGSLSQPPPAQAAPAGAEYAYFVFATIQGGENATICVGDNIPISVNVKYASLGSQTGSWYSSGIWVAGSVQDPGIGKLKIDRKKTGFDYEQPGTASFIFHADKPGKTTLIFNAEIHYYQSTILKWIYGPAKTAASNPIDVTVEDCQYKVTATSHWGGEFALEHNYEAFTVVAVLTADTPGHYTGTATVYWVISNPPPERCPHSITTTTQVDLTGVMDADGQRLVVDMTYQPGMENWIVLRSDDCTTPAAYTDAPMIPDPLKFSVPASGGGLTQSHGMTSYESGVLSGSANVTVIRVTSH